MKGIISFFKTRTFALHFILAVISLTLVLWFIFKLMGSYTQHGEIVKVPDFTGQHLKDLDNFVADKQVRYEIIDSVYSPKDEPGVVIRQEPEKETDVKHNRTIYLYVTSLLPPQIAMPKLVDRSLRQATAMIESYGLKLGKTKYVADPCSNCILKQFYEGKEIGAGTLIKKGSVIDLQVGKGFDAGNAEGTTVPDVIGLSYCEAKKKLQDVALNIGALIFDKPVKDSCSAYVYRQSPMGGSSIVGSGIDLYLTGDKSKLELLNKNSSTDDEPEDEENQ